MSLAIPHLSPREHQICSLLTSGATNKAIAGKLKISQSTVKEYLDRMFARIGCQSRTELAVRFVQGAAARKKPPRAKPPKNREKQ